MSASAPNRGHIKPRTRRRLEQGCLAVALLGLLMMVQPVTQLLFRPGFFALFVAGIAYVSTTFWRPEGVSARGIAATLLWTVATLTAIVALSIWLAPRLL